MKARLASKILLGSEKKKDTRGVCHRRCIYNDNDRCDMWDELSVPDETEKCDNQI